VAWPSASARGTLTIKSLNSGSHFETGSVNWIVPSSTKVMAATDNSGFVIEYARKIASLTIGVPLSWFWNPKLSE
jgi:hypothetical protein